MASTAHTVTMRGAQIGLKLRDDHPQAKGKHALYLDEGAFVLLDKMSKVSPSKKTGLIHHAEIRMISSHYGKRFPLIVGTEKPSGRAVVFASASTPKGVKSKVRFAQAVFAHASQIVLEDKSSALLELFDGESFDTLFETGRVDRYEAKSGQLKPVALDRADMALARIAYARSFEKCGVASVQDAVLHELLHVYRMEALSRDAVMECVYALMESKKWELRPGVASVCAAALRANSTVHFHGLNELLGGALTRKQKRA